MKTKTLLLLLLLVAGIINTSQSQTLDQSQLLSNSGISARTLAGYKIFQSFTCGTTGTLVEVDLGVFNAINGQGTLQIFAGGTNSGTILQTIPVTVTCASGNCFANFTTSVAVTAGQVYTFQFTPGAGIPDPYGVSAQVPGNYSGGQFGLVDPSGTYYPGWDLVFKTYVTTVLGVKTLDFDNTTTKLYPNPFSAATNLQINAPVTDATLTLFNVYGQQVQQIKNISEQNVVIHRDGLSNGVYLLQLTEADKLIGTEKLVLSN
jgi:Secretion system C-terminal sorting domain